MNYIELNRIHPSWNDFFTDEVKSLLNDIDAQISGECNPNPSVVLRFAQYPLDESKVLILGQDVYPAAHVATGLAFEVNGLSSWSEPFRQISLKNIVRRLYADYTGESAYTPFSQVKEAISGGTFLIAYPDELFANWAGQGVLLLNTALTCRTGEAGSHTDIWMPFTEKLLEFIASARPDIHIFLWGNYAREFAKFFPTQIVHQSRHPMMCSIKYEDDFLKFDGFHQTAHIINWLG